MSSNDRLKCSFCGKTQDQVKKLIAGPDVFICDECVELCNEILDEEFFEQISFMLEVPFDEVINKYTLFKVTPNSCGIAPVLLTYLSIFGL